MQNNTQSTAKYVSENKNIFKISSKRFLIFFSHKNYAFKLSFVFSKVGYFKITTFLSIKYSVE